MWCHNFMTNLHLRRASTKVRLLFFHRVSRSFGSTSHAKCSVRLIKTPDFRHFCAFNFRTRHKLLQVYARCFSLSNCSNTSDDRPKMQEQVRLTRDLLENAASFSNETRNHPEDIWCTSSYPITNESTQKDNGEEEKMVDLSKRSVIMFPGQGAQFRGMGRNLLQFPIVSEMYKTASEIVNYDLLKLCLEGPQEQLNETRYCQVALLVTSLAAVEKLRDTNPVLVENCMATMGFSVGEFAALVFAGALSFEEAVHLVHIRGEAMQAATDLIPSGMMTVFLGPAAPLNPALEAALEWASKEGVEKPVCSIANYLYPSCKVIGGNAEALNFIEKNHKEFRIKDTRRISVSGAFHTALMEPAMEAWELALSKVTFSKPIIRVYSNVTGETHKMKTMNKLLVKHLVRPVKWEQTLHNVYQQPKDKAKILKFPQSYVCGPGESLKAILKRVNMKCWDYTYPVKV